MTFIIFYILHQKIKIRNTFPLVAHLLPPCSEENFYPVYTRIQSKDKMKYRMHILNQSKVRKIKNKQSSVLTLSRAVSCHTFCTNFSYGQYKLIKVIMI